MRLTDQSEASIEVSRERAKIVGRACARGSKYKIQQSQLSLRKTVELKNQRVPNDTAASSQQSTFLCLPGLFERWCLHQGGKQTGTGEDHHYQPVSFKDNQHDEPGWQPVSSPPGPAITRLSQLLAPLNT